MRVRHFFIAMVLLHCTTAWAYIGPGVGTGVIATVIGVLGALILALVGIVYYPIKRFIKSRKARCSARKIEPPRP